ncbi:MAG TPA: helix-turn-helix transcriptional regulator [Yinghuangia sp.]|nr:helix-turn-helix transcriptional regulator [Yinghuangia sp.]
MEHPPTQDPTVAKRRLRDALRRLREEAQLTQREVAEAMDWSPSKLIRIEASQVTVSTTDLRALLAHYAVTDPDEVANLVALGRAARERAWWSAYSKLVPARFLEFIGFESSASVIRNFEPLTVPGLLQTREYAREVLQALRTPNVDDMVDLRMGRQELLTRDNPPDLHFILDQAVIHRVVGSPKVMQRQLRHILDVAEFPNVTVRVVPWSVGFYPRYEAAYVHIEFPTVEDPAALYQEKYGGITRESLQDETPADYLTSFWELEQAAPVTLAPVLIQEAIAALGRMSANPGSPAPDQ